MNPIEALMETATPLQRKLLEGCRYVEETGCWEWVKSRHMRVYDDRIGRSGSARPMIFEEFVGPIERNDKLKLTCRNSLCVNPTHMVPHVSADYGFWNDKENINAEAKKYDSRKSFNKGASAAYASAVRLGILDEVCSHMSRYSRFPSGYWQDDTNIKRAASECETRKEFEKKYVSGYHAAIKKGILDEVCAHMLHGGRKWHTLEQIKKEAEKYESRVEFSIKSSGAYQAALKYGWLDNVCSHMVETKKPDGYWEIKQNCAKEALKYDRRKKFDKGSPFAYKAACRNGWLDEICSHMTHGHVKWAYDSCKTAASTCVGRADFSVKFSAAYKVSNKNGWLDEFFPKPA